MADQIALDAAQLRDEAQTFGRTGRRIKEFSSALTARMNQHNPDSGDATGQAIGAQYFAAAGTLLAGSSTAAELLVDMADLIVAVADRGEDVDVAIAALLEDVGGQDAKLIDGGGAADPSSSSERAGSKH